MAATMSSGALEALVPELTPTASDRMNVVSFLFLFAVDGIVQQGEDLDDGWLLVAMDRQKAHPLLRHGPALLRALYPAEFT